MTNDLSQETIEQKPIPFGTRLKNAREALGLERKEVAMQLRLPEKIIIMMEKERYAADLPPTFIRGYVKSYGKFLQLPDSEINKAIEPIKPKSGLSHIIPFSARSLVPVTSRHYFMQIFTYCIIFTIFGLLSIWWYNHSNLNSSVLIETAGNALVENIGNAKHTLTLVTEKSPLSLPSTNTMHNNTTPVKNVVQNKSSNQLTAANTSTKKVERHNADDPYIDDMDINE